MQRVASLLGDSRIRIYRHPENYGLTRGLNNALSQTDAEFIAIVGSGDSCHASRIERQVLALDDRPDAVFCATASTTFDPVRRTTFFDSRHDSATITLTDIQEECPFTHGSVMYRASALRAVGNYETTLKWCADWDMFFRLLRIGDAVFLPDVLYMRTAQADGVSFNPAKSFEQIRCKRLVLRLSDLSMDGRHELLKRVQSDGLNEVLDNVLDHVGRDAARRNVKLFLMGRTEAGDEMLELARHQDVSYPRRYRRLMPVARALGKLPLNTDGLIRAARALPR